MSEEQYVEVTPEMLADLHKQKEELRGKIDQAKGRLEALNHQKDVQIRGLEAYGVTPETAEERMEQLQKEISDLYIKANKIVEGIKNAERSEN